MTVVTVVGDVATTTTLAIAAGWRSGPACVLEADPLGGSIASWLDIPYSPSLTDLVAARRDERRTLGNALGRLTPSGLRVIPAPLRATEAARVCAIEAADDLIASAARTLTPSHGTHTLLIDAGRPHPGRRPPAAVRHADVVVVVHRQRPESARASAARLQRAAELAEWLREMVDPGDGFEIVVTVVGDAPFSPAEVAAHVGVEDDVAAVLPVDLLAAAVLAGRTGISARRVARLPLMRAAAALADRLADLAAQRTGVPA